jgi:uncharacterized protein (TIGR03083 family)
VSTAERLLLIEAAALEPILRAAPADAFDRPTVCDGWSVRDVLAHCAAALTAVTEGNLHAFTPEDNQRDVDERRPWPLDRLLDELVGGYRGAAAVIAGAEGRLDGIAVGEWVHGGDVREPLGEPDAYTSAGVDLALELLVERSRARLTEVVVQLSDRRLTFGRGGEVAGVETDLETLVRLLSGRRPDPARYRLDGIDARELTLFS